MSVVMRRIAKQNSTHSPAAGHEPAPHGRHSSAENTLAAHHRSTGSHNSVQIAATPRSTHHGLAQIVTPPPLAYPQLPSAFGSPAQSDLAPSSAYLLNLLPALSLSNPILKPHVPSPPLPTNPDTPHPLSHLTYLPANYAQKFKSRHSKSAPLDSARPSPDRRSSPATHSLMSPSTQQTMASATDMSHRPDGPGIVPNDIPIVEPPPASTALAHRQTTLPPLEKSPLSFFKRPIRLIREKKGPPDPLLVDSNPLSFKTHETNKLAPLSPTLSRPSKLSYNTRAHSDHPSKTSPNPHTHLAPMQKVPSSLSTGSKLNSLLTAAARSIRTGDSRLFESFQSAISPRIPSDNEELQMPPPIQPTWTRTQTPPLLKRIPVPAYRISGDIVKSPISPRLTRTTSLERPKTATKHSRTSSLPHSQAPPAIKLSTPQEHPRISRQDLDKDQCETIEKLSEPEVDNKSAHVSPLPSQPEPTQIQVSPSDGQLRTSTPQDPNLNIQPHPTLLLEGDSDGLDNQYSEPPQPTPAIEHPIHKPELYLSGARSHRSASTLSYEDFRGLVSRAMGSPLTINHRIKYRKSYMSQRESQASQLSLSPLNDQKDERPPHGDRDSVSAPVIEVNKRFLQRESSLASVHEAKRKSFECMPLPALPPPSAHERIPPAKDNHAATAAVATIKKQARPWTMVIPGSFSGRKELPKLLPELKRKNHKEEKLVASPSRKSPLAQRKTRHSYPLRLAPHFSPLEQVSIDLRFLDPVSQTGKPLHLEIRTAGELEYRDNLSSRTTPSLTPTPTNLMFGFRGEVYEVDKCEKPVDVRQSIKVPFDYDQEHEVKSLLDYQSLNTIRLSQAFGEEKQPTDLAVEQHDKPAHSPGSNNPQFETEVAIPEQGLDSQHVVSDLPPRIDLDLDDLAQSIELKEICLIGAAGEADKEDFRAGRLQRRITQEILIEPPSPRLSERNCSTENIMETLSIDIGSSEDDSFRLPDDSLPFEFGTEPKIINPETSLEMAASILGQPVPEVSKEIWRGFERLHSMTEARFMESEGKELREVLGRLFEPGTPTANPTTEVGVQTDPVAFASRNDHFVSQPPFIIRKDSTRRVADALKRLSNKADQTIHSPSTDPLPRHLTRHSFQSERGFAPVYRESIASLQDYAKSGGARMDSPRTSAGGNNRTTTPWSERKQTGLNEISEFKRFSSKRTAHSIHLSHFSSPLRQTPTLESHLGLLSYSPLTTSPILTETVLGALDNALRAEETFQREKQHLQSVARRQSQTIESLLLDKEILSLEVTRLTGLVELLTRDHNLLNERIDKAEEAFEKMPPAPPKNPPPTTVGDGGGGGYHSPDETASYCTAAADPIHKTTTRVSLLADQKADQKRQHAAAGREQQQPLTETDDGVMGGDSEESSDDDDDDDEDDDRDSLCDPEQDSVIQSAVILFASPRTQPFTHPKIHSPIPGSYPVLPSVPGP
ncbi:hypothetical protein PCANC_09642 [Puccinia coronata f. sp. avenae]|uniref:Uncharacterized protein n=1 Tax=Puccinia coronata f. sp. avenae TaxID=200324 RepID=A0A2N5V1K7_9BASI|nr:hypothetical protein PCASD_10589 [Puccinia coronata f. sp. avenae]PLW43888.1 hypothetical protein PCANC_09642 [Puccinia coronata f. sp. avenae]